MKSRFAGFFFCLYPTEMEHVTKVPKLGVAQSFDKDHHPA
jgi:hypothetical protein